MGAALRLLHLRMEVKHYEVEHLGKESAVRPSFWVPTTACPRTIFSLIWTSLLSVLAVEPSVSY